MSTSTSTWSGWFASAEPICLGCLLFLLLLLLALVLTGQIGPPPAAVVTADLRTLLPRSVVDTRLAALVLPAFEPMVMLELIQDTTATLEQRLESTVVRSQLRDYLPTTVSSATLRTQAAAYQTNPATELLSTQIAEYGKMSRYMQCRYITLVFADNETTHCTSIFSEKLVPVTKLTLRSAGRIVVLAESPTYYIGVKDSHVVVCTTAGDAEVGRYPGPEPWLDVYPIPQLGDLFILMQEGSIETTRWSADFVSNRDAPYVRHVFSAG